MQCGLSSRCTHLALLAGIALRCVWANVPGDGTTGGGVEDHYAKLKSDLFGDSKKYDSKKRPVLRFTDTLDVKLFLVFLHIFDLDEATGTLQVNGWAEVSWEDEHLKWDTEKYGGLRHLEVPERMVWKPDLTVLNSVQPKVLLSDFSNTLLYVTSEGTIYWIFPFFVKSSCPMDHSAFPFDEHFCTVKVGSWIYTSNALTFSSSYTIHPEKDVIAKFTVENPLWEMVEETQAFTNLTFECCPDEVFVIHESILHVRRNSPFHKFLFVVPGVMSMLLTLLVFWMSPTAGGRITVSGIVVFMQMMMLVTLSVYVPKGGRNVPRIVLLCGNSLVMSCLSLIVSVVAMRLCRMSTYKPLPSVIKNFLSGNAGYLLCLGGNTFQTDTSVLNETKPENGTPETNFDNGSANFSNKPSAFGDWILLATAIDHVCFIVYSLIFAIILASCVAV